MADFDDLSYAAFDGIDFPWTKISIHGGLRDHVHEFPHTPGGKPEKMGRKLYEIEFSSPFLSNSVNPKWKDLWPLNLAVFRTKFERQITSALHIPTIGTIQAYCFDWGQEAEARKRNGEMTTWKFREDSPDLYLVSDVIKVSPASLGLQMEKLQAEANTVGSSKALTEALNAIEGAVNDVLAIRDTATMYSTLAESKVNYLTFVCSEADRTIDQFKDPGSWRILEALKELWASSKELAANFVGEASPMRTYITPTEMTIAEVAIAVYGDAGRGMDILRLNAVQDAFAIPAGTSLRYYLDEAA